MNESFLHRLAWIFVILTVAPIVAAALAAFTGDLETWRSLAETLRGQVDFIIEPYTRFEGEPGEQATMFFEDPSGNAIELKAFADMSQLFAT